MAEGKPTNVPFSLNDDEEDIFTSADFDRAPELRTSSALDAIQSHDTGANPAVSKPSQTGPQKAVAHPVLTVQTGSIKQKIPIDKPLVTLGLEDANVPLSDAFVDRWHAVLRNVDGHVVVEDMGSLNGIFLRIEDDLPLEDRDEIALGNQRFVFRTTWDPVASQKSRSAMAAGGAVTPITPRLIQKLEGGRVGFVYPIKDSLAIGSAPSNDATIADDSLSPVHATIVKSGDRYAIKNADTSSGTFIRIYDPVELINGDCFLVGTTLVSIHYP